MYVTWATGLRRARLHRPGELARAQRRAQREAPADGGRGAGVAGRRQEPRGRSSRRSRHVPAQGMQARAPCCELGQEARNRARALGHCCPASMEQEMQGRGKQAKNINLKPIETKPQHRAIELRRSSSSFLTSHRLAAQCRDVRAASDVALKIMRRRQMKS